MNLRHLDWLIGEPLPDLEVIPDRIICLIEKLPPDPEVISYEIPYEILPYSREDADRIIRHLCALAKFDLGQMRDDPARAERVRQAFRLIVEAARARQALLDLDELERDLGKPPWRDRLRNLRNDRRQFATVIRDRGARAALRGALIDLGQASRAGRRWLHYLRDRPDVLRNTIERALKAPVLQGALGRPSAFDRVPFAWRVGRAYELLTDRPFGRSVTSDTMSQPGGKPTGPGLRLVSVCLKPLVPDIKDHRVAWAIRRAKRLVLRDNRLIWLP